MTCILVGAPSAFAGASSKEQNRFYIFEIGLGGGVKPLSKLVNIGGKYGAEISANQYGMIWYELGLNLEYEWYETGSRMFAKPEFALAYGAGLLLSVKAGVYTALAWDSINTGLIGIGTRPTICFLAVCGYYAAEIISDGRGFDHAKGGIYFTAPITCVDKKNCLGSL